MNDFIPPATVNKLAFTFPNGTRHNAALSIAIPLLGNGLPATAVFATLRSKFPPDVTDKELRDIIRWAEDKHPTPSTPRITYRPEPVGTVVKPKTPAEQVDWWTSGSRLSPDELIAHSPIPIPDNPVESAELMFSCLFKEHENLNLITLFSLLPDDPKPKPKGAGKILPRNGWIDYFKKNGVPSSEAGAWMRINPCNAVGSGAGHAVCDSDITAFRYLLVESDCLPIHVQLAMWQRLKLPIAAIVLSGGGSAHAWVVIGAHDLSSYKERSKRVLAMLKPFGVDDSNSNASRLCRLPGAVRTIGATEGGKQRLLWVNPNAVPLTDESLKSFEESLLFPAIEEKPLLSLARSSIDRYEEMRKNKGKLGVPTGIPDLDAISGGLKPGWSVVIAGETGGGKSTMALHIIDAALQAGYGVLLFSLEMDKDEIFDLLVASRCLINRNNFNNGDFTDCDILKMTEKMGEIAKLPLYIEDSSLSSADQIRMRALQLKSAGKIGLIVVDYIQFVNPGFTKENREQQVAGISHALRTVARETRLPMVILSQLNEEGKLRESRVISHNANVVLQVGIDNETLTVEVTKGRGIPYGKYTLRFNRRFCKLEPAPKIDARDYDGYTGWRQNIDH